MMKKIIYICTLMFSFTLIAQSTINKDLNDFTTLQVYNGIEVTLVKSSDQKIEITGDKSEMVVIKNTNNTLKLALPFSTNPEKNAANGQISVQLFYNKNINSIEVNDESTVTGIDLNQDKLVLNAQERGYINLSVKTENLDVTASSGGIIEVSGTTKNQNADIDLYGTYHSFDLKAEGISTVKCGTGAKAEVLAGETLNAKVSFGGSIFYKGNPKLVKDKKVIGGIIKKRD